MKNNISWETVKNIISWFLLRVLKLNVSEKQINTMVQFIKFGIVGISNTVLSYVIYVACLTLFQSIGIFHETDYLIAQFIAFMLSVLWSFYWNNKFVFARDNIKRNWFRALMKTYISYAFTGLFLNSVLSLLWVEIFHWSKLIAPLINLIISVPINFLLNKFWAFGEK